MLAWKDGEQAEASEAAEYFLLNNEDVWKNWTSSDARLAIKEELGMM